MYFFSSIDTKLKESMKFFTPLILFLISLVSYLVYAEYISLDPELLIILAFIIIFNVLSNKVRTFLYNILHSQREVVLTNITNIFEHTRRALLERKIWKKKEIFISFFTPKVTYQIENVTKQKDQIHSDVIKNITDSAKKMIK